MQRVQEKVKKTGGIGTSAYNLGRFFSNIITGQSSKTRRPAPGEVGKLAD